MGAVIGTATAFASPALDALVPQLVPGRRTDQANAIDQFVRPTAIQLAGPALGGLAVAALHPWGAFALDAATFAFSALCVLQMAPVAGPQRRAAACARCGSRACATYATTSGCGGLSCRPRSPTFCSSGRPRCSCHIVVRNTLHHGASTYGAVLAAGGVGAVDRGDFDWPAAPPERPMLWIYGWWALATLAVAGYGLATSPGAWRAAAVVVNGAEAAAPSSGPH